MPHFDTPDEARDYIRRKRLEGMECQQTFGLEGIDVFCKFAVERPTHTAHAIKRNPPPPPPPQRQEVFHTENKIELPHELRDYQQEAVAFVMQHPHAIVELPTGRGKTLTAIGIVNEIMQRKPGSRVLVIVPTNVLLHQWINDGFKEAGIAATGYSGEVKQWGEHTVTTYMSAIRNLQQLDQFDIIIFDEVHHLFAEQSMRILERLQHKPFLIGLTATRREYGEGRILQNRYFPNVFSKTIEEFQTGESKIPVEVEMIPVRFDESETEIYERDNAIIKKANKSLGPVPEWSRYFNSYDNNLKRLSRAAISAYAEVKRLLTETPDKLQTIVDIIERTPGQFIVFADTIDAIKNIEAALRRARISEGSIYSGVKPAKRKQIIEGLRDKSIRVLVGGAAITEGLDVPDIANGILASMLVKSSRTYVQRVGRVLRPRPGKRVRLFLIYVSGTMEAQHAQKVKELMGEKANGYFS